MFGCFDIFEFYGCNVVYYFQGRLAIQISFLLAQHAETLKTAPKQEHKTFPLQALEN